MARSASGGWQPSDRHASAELACRACEGAVVQAPAPERLIRNGIPTEALVAVRNGPEMRNDDGEISTSEFDTERPSTVDINARLAFFR